MYQKLHYSVKVCWASEFFALKRTTLPTTSRPFRQYFHASRIFLIKKIRFPRKFRCKIYWLKGRDTFNCLIHVILAFQRVVPIYIPTCTPKQVILLHLNDRKGN